MSINRLSIGVKLIIAMFAVVLLCLPASSYWIHQKVQDNTFALAQKEAQALGSRYVQEVKRTLDEGMERAKLLAALLQAQLATNSQNRETVAETMRTVMEHNPNMAGYWLGFEPNAFDNNDATYAGQAPLHDETGRFIAFYYNFGKGVVPHRLNTYDETGEHADYYNVPKATKAPFLMRPYPYDIDGHNVLMASVTYPVLDANGDFLGVAGVDIYLNTLAERMAALRPYGTGSINLISDDGIWISHTDENLLGQRLDTHKPHYAAALSRIRKGEAYIHKGEAFTYLFLPISIKDITKPWSVVVNIPNAALTSVSDKLSEIMSINALVVILLLIAALYFVGTKLIRDPLQRMTEVMKRLANGDLHVPVPAITRGDEIGEMAKAVLVFKDNAIERAHLQEQQATAQKELEYQAHHDQLTGVHNRFALENVENTWLSPNASPFALFYLDLDNFKNINDAFGHVCGDYILAEVAKRLRQTLPTGSFIARHGGDEFIIFAHYDDSERLANLAADLIKTIADHYIVSGMKLHVGASIGITRFPHDSLQLETLRIGADLAMREAKRKKNCYIFYSENMHDDVRQRIAVEYQLRHALERNEIYMVYQPQISRDGTLHGVEALVRWYNDELGFVPPDQFISVAEETGLIVPLGNFIIRRACSEFAEILKAYASAESDQAPCVSINISINQLLELKFEENLVSAIKGAGLETHHVTIEITESLFIDEPDTILPLLQDIRKTGINVSLDDFGTGYSSLSILRTLPIDELKIDKSFIDNICQVKQDAEMTQSIIDMGHIMETHIVSEGVEDKEQVRLLVEMGCDVIQGYYYAKPLAKDEIIAFVQQHPRQPLG